MLNIGQIVEYDIVMRHLWNFLLVFNQFCYLFTEVSIVIMHIGIELLPLYFNSLLISLSLLLIQLFLNLRSTFEFLHLLKQLLIPHIHYTFSQETNGEDKETSILGFESWVGDYDVYDSFVGDLYEMFVAVIVIKVLDIVTNRREVILFA